MDTDAWKLQHMPHLGPGQRFVAQPYSHPSGEWYSLVCPCGARHISTQRAEEP